MKKFLLAALMAGAASSALAADLPTHKAPPPPAPVYAPPPFTWTGFYIGVNGGFGFSSTGPSSFGHIDGGLVGGTAGYNYQIGQFVVGVEGDLDWSGLRGSTNGALLGVNRLTTDDMVTARARLGYAMDRTLFYVTGGYAGIEANGTFNDFVTPLTGSQSVWHNGGVVGAGIEYAFTNNISLKGEYLYAPMFQKTYFPGTPDAESAGLGINLFRAGLNYKF